MRPNNAATQALHLTVRHVLPLPTLLAPPPAAIAGNPPYSNSEQPPQHTRAKAPHDGVADYDARLTVQLSPLQHTTAPSAPTAYPPLPLHVAPPALAPRCPPPRPSRPRSQALICCQSSVRQVGSAAVAGTAPQHILLLTVPHGRALLHQPPQGRQGSPPSYGRSEHPVPQRYAKPQQASQRGTLAVCSGSCVHVVLKLTATRRADAPLHQGLQRGLAACCSSTHGSRTRHTASRQQLQQRTSHQPGLLPISCTREELRLTLALTLPTQRPARRCQKPHRLHQPLAVSAVSHGHTSRISPRPNRPRGQPTCSSHSTMGMLPLHATTGYSSSVMVAPAWCSHAAAGTVAPVTACGRASDASAPRHPPHCQAPGSAP